MRKGMTILEVTLAAVILAITVASIFPVLGWLVTRSKEKQFDSQASTVLTQGIEVAYNVLLSDWNGYSDGIYHPAVDISSGTWVLVTGNELVETRFTRKVDVAEVCRDNSTGEKVEGACGGTSAVDPNSKNIRSTVSWIEKGVTREIAAELLLTKL